MLPLRTRDDGREWLQLRVPKSPFSTGSMFPKEKIAPPVLDVLLQVLLMFAWLALRVNYCCMYI